MPRPLRQTRQSAARLAALCLLLPALCASAWATPDVAALVRDFLHAQAGTTDEGVEVEVFQPNARFPVCERPRAFLPPNSPSPLRGRVSVGVRCNDDPSGVRYLSARITVTGTYIEVAEVVPPGTVLGPGMLVERRGDLGRLPPHAIRDADAALGLVAQRHLSPGSILQEHHLGRMPLVERGQRVEVVSGGAGFVVRREGEAMEAGGLGERVRVRLSPRENLTGVVSAPGQVRAGR